MEVKPKKKKN